jgi:hypothetical protein
VLKKEFKDTLKTLVHCLLMLIIIPMAMLLDWHVFHSQWEVSGIWQPVFTAMVILFAVYSGISIFQSEKKDKALEYMFTLPVSIRKIMAIKVFPRLVLLVLLIAAGGIFSVFKNIAADGVSLIFLFFIAVFASLAVDSLVNGMIGVVLLNVVLYYTSLIISYLTMEIFGSNSPLFLFSHLLSVVLLLVPLAAAFAMTLKNFDAKPLKWQARHYLVIALPTVLILASFILVFIKKYMIWVRTIG